MVENGKYSYNKQLRAVWAVQSEPRGAACEGVALRGCPQLPPNLTKEPLLRRSFADEKKPRTHILHPGFLQLLLLRWRLLLLVLWICLPVLQHLQRLLRLGPQVRQNRERLHRSEV